MMKWMPRLARKCARMCPAMVALLIVLGFGVVGVRGQDSAKPQAAKPEPVPFEEETLPNGLKVIYSPLRQAPVVHVRVIYHVGSRDERPDRQGFAHMFEHMMFRGSAHVGPQDHVRLINSAGGSCNGQTEHDVTSYFDTLPANQLELALWLAAGPGGGLQGG